MSNNFSPRVNISVGGFWVPTGDVTVEQSAYGTADIIRATTYAWGNYDFGRMSQKFMPVHFIVNAGTSTSSSQLISGILDEVDTTAEDDTLELRGRGSLALLIDRRVSLKPLANETADKAIAQIITDAGLTPQVTPTAYKVGRWMKDDNNVSIARNIRALDVVQSLAWGSGFRVRTQGTTVIVGPPPDPTKAFVLKVRWASGEHSGEKLNVTHSALHAHGVKVKVVSYIWGSKQSVTSSTVQGPLAASLDFPAPAGKSTASSRSGSQSSTSLGESENPNTQEYVYVVHNKTKAECDIIQQNITRQIARKEFKIHYSFTPTPDEMTQMIKSSPEFLLDLSNAPLPSNNGLYHPEKITWRWQVGQEGGGPSVGLTVDFEGVNHDIPVPAGSQLNT